MSNDRTEIAEFMSPIFPSMKGNISSYDWHGFLNSISGLDIPIEEENVSAFDKWRIALADLGYPTWDYSPKAIAHISKRGEELKAAEMKRQSELSVKLEAAAIEAPHVAAIDLLPK